MHLNALCHCGLTFGGVFQFPVAVESEAIQEVMPDKVMDEVMQAAVLTVRCVCTYEGKVASIELERKGYMREEREVGGK